MALVSPKASVDDSAVPQAVAARHRTLPRNDPPNAKTVGIRSDASLDSALIRLARTSLHETHFRAAAAAFSTDLALLIGAARVTLGWLIKDDIKLIAVSNSGSAELETDQTDLLRNAMHESIDQRCTLQFPPPRADLRARHILRAQHVLTRATGGSVITLPLIEHGRAVGAMVIEFSAIDPITPDLLSLAKHSMQVMAPVLSLMREREVPWYRRIFDSTSHRRSSAARTRMWRYLGSIGAIVLLAATFVPVKHRVSAPARIEGEVQRMVASPTKGYLKSVKVRPGDLVKAGQLLAELGERDLELERNKFKSEIAQHEGASAAAFAKGDRAAMSISQAKADEARAQLGLIDHQLEQIQLTAPIDGILIQGDLAQSIGAPIDRGQSLFTIAPVDRFRVIVELDERDIRAVVVGQKGELALSAMPWDTIAVSIKRIAPMASIVENRNVFELETVLAGTARDVRPGLRGTAHIAIGESTVMAIWGTRALNALKRWSWRLTP